MAFADKTLVLDPSANDAALVTSSQYAVTGNCWRYNTNRHVPAVGREHFVGTYVYISDDYWTFCPRFAFAASYLTGRGAGGQEANLGNAFAIDAVSLRIERSGAINRLTFDGGEHATTIEDGSFKVSDAPSDVISIPPRSKVYVTVAGHVASGAYRPGLAQGLRDTFGERVEYGTSSLAARALAPDTISATIPTTDDVYLTGPVAGFALGWDGRPSVLVLGTSIEEGTGGVRHKCGPLGERGHADYAMTTTLNATQRLPHLNWSRDDAVADGINLSGGFAKRADILTSLSNVPVTTVVDFLGTNDRENDTDSWRSKIVNCVAAVKALLPDVRYVKTTMLPRTSSSDGFRTVVNQRQTGEWASYPSAAATQVDNWIMTGDSGADVAFDIREYWDGQGSTGTCGKFRADFKGDFSTTLPFAISLGSVTIQLNALPELGTVLVVDPRGMPEVRTVFSHGSISSDGPYFVQMSGVEAAAFEHAHPCGVAVVEAIIEDGTHPSWPMSREIGPLEGAAMKAAGVVASGLRLPRTETARCVPPTSA